MRRWVLIACGIAGLASVAAGLLTWMYIGERPIIRYPARAEAERDGAFSRGWLPGRVPSGAKEIIEAHDLDTNQRWVAFRAPEPELRAMTKELQPISYGEMRQLRPTPPGRMGGEWPPETRADFWHILRGSDLLAYFRDPRERYCYAVEWRAARAWGWSCDAGAAEPVAAGDVRPGIVSEVKDHQAARA